MGTPVPPPIPPPPVPPGEPCEFCWGPGKPFGAFPTPSQITVDISGVAKGPNWQEGDGDPPNGSYDLPQDESFSPCIFELIGAINLFVGYGPFVTSVSGSIEGGQSFFLTPTGNLCSTVVPNQLNDHFTGGTATITIP